MVKTKQAAPFIAGQPAAYNIQPGGLPIFHR